MSTYDKNKSRFFQRMVDIGADHNSSITEIRYLRVTNIASVLGVIYNVTWMLIALFLTDALVIYGSNTFLGLMFLMALIFNRKGWRVLASVWLILASYMSVLLFLYLLGYSSGVAVVCFLIIILPYRTFPRKARNIAHVFSILACMPMMVSVLLLSNITSQFGGLDP